MENNNTIKEKWNFFDVTALIIGTLVLFMQPLKYVNKIFTYIDETLIMLMLVTYIGDLLKRKKIKKDELLLIFVFILFILAGIIGNSISSFERETKAILLDIFSFSKFFLVAICGIRFFEKTNHAKRLISFFAFVVKINLIIAFPLSIMNQFVDLGMRDEVRHGIYCFKYIYDTAAIFSWYCLMYLIVLSVEAIINKKKNSKLFIALNIMTWIMTGRSRGFAFCLIYILMFIYNKKVKREKKQIRFKPLQIAILGVIGLLIAWKQFVFYFTTSTEARYILLHYGITLCKMYFPIGAGFATFGTFSAQTYYSPVYNYFGINKIYGFSEENPLYLTDNFWPAILGETGVIGFMFYFVAAIICFKILYKRLGRNNDSKFIIIYFIITIICSSIATTIFTQNATIGDVFFLCSIAGILKGEEDGKAKY